MKKDLPKEKVVISAANLKSTTFKIIGLSPYVSHAFGQKAREEMVMAQSLGSKGKNKKTKEPKNFDACYEQSKHISTDGWCGIPASAFRSAMISACRLCGFVMTKAKLSIFVVPDGFDVADGTPLVRITKGDPHHAQHAVRLPNGTFDIRSRAMWSPGWEAQVTVQWDNDQFSAVDAANLLSRVGLQVGIGEGRPDSRQSPGMGWGLFRVAEGEWQV